MSPAPETPTATVLEGIARHCKRVDDRLMLGGQLARLITHLHAESAAANRAPGRAGDRVSQEW